VYRDQKSDQQLEAQWVLAQKMSALGRLAGNLSHELNNPLSGLRALAQYWIQQTQEPQIRSDFEEIETATERSQNLIQKLVRFSSSSVADNNIFDWDEMVRETLPLLKSSFRKLRLELDLQAPGARVHADEILFQQVVYNLIKNAAQAQADKAADQSWIRLESRILAPNQLVFRVVDNGPGISESVQSQIFQAFFSTKQPGEGTGLGLFFAQQILQRFGGKIGFRNHPGAGGEFILEVPLQEVLL
jgi:two-component system NtrC family sensor kinase